LQLSFCSFCAACVVRSGVFSAKLRLSDAAWDSKACQPAQQGHCQPPAQRSTAAHTRAQAEKQRGGTRGGAAALRRARRPCWPDTSIRLHPPSPAFQIQRRSPPRRTQPAVFAHTT
jgi:hypothetical protein